MKRSELITMQMKKFGISQGKLCEVYGFDPHTVRKWRTDDTVKIRKRHMIILSELLQMSEEQLLPVNEQLNDEDSNLKYECEEYWNEPDFIKDATGYFKTARIGDYERSYPEKAKDITIEYFGKDEIKNKNVVGYCNNEYVKNKLLPIIKENDMSAVKRDDVLIFPDEIGDMTLEQFFEWNDKDEEEFVTHIFKKRFKIFTQTIYKRTEPIEECRFVRKSYRTNEDKKGIKNIVIAFAIAKTYKLDHVLYENIYSDEAEIFDIRSFVVDSLKYCDLSRLSGKDIKYMFLRFHNMHHDHINELKLNNDSKFRTITSYMSDVISVAALSGMCEKDNDIRTFTEYGRWLLNAANEVFLVDMTNVLSALWDIVKERYFIKELIRLLIYTMDYSYENYRMSDEDYFKMIDYIGRLVEKSKRA